jgi:hypothetical protein
MPQHIGIVACSAEGAALCYRTICTEGPSLLGGHAHPEVSMHSLSLVRRTILSSCLVSSAAIGIAQTAVAQEALQSTSSDNDLVLASSSADEAALRAAAGALVEVTLESRVGVVLDEIPQSQRAAAASYYLNKPNQFWKDRASLQARHTNYRLTYRHLFYADSDPPKGMMAMPPQELWRIDL